MIARVEALPGVLAAGGVNAFPLGPGAREGRFIILSPATERLVAETIARCGARLAACGPEAFEPFGRIYGDAAQVGDAEFRVASDGYFRAMGIPIVRGRPFDARDAAGAPHAAVISESLAARRWPGQDPLGLRIEFGNMDGDLTPLTIVGIAGDVRERGMDQPPSPVVYTSARQRPMSAAIFTVAVHTAGEASLLVPRIRAIVRGLAPDVAVEFRTIEQVIASSLSDRRVMVVLLGAFAGCALLLASVGIYGAVAYSVAQRTREIGVRLALGAAPGDIRRLVLAYGARVAFAGFAIGTVVALAAARALDSLLYEVTPADPVTYGACVTVLAVMALAAALVPAERAMRVDPATALRME